MFVHISPEPEALGETISTLKFAERVSTIELGTARVHKDNGEVKELKEQVLTTFFLGRVCVCERERESMRIIYESITNLVPKILG